MIHEETRLVTLSNGPAPAGPPDECFFCGETVGREHKPDCVCRVRTVMIEVTIQIPHSAPEAWSVEEIEAHLNDGFSCKDNLLDEIDVIFQQSEKCSCSFASGKYIREATDSDESNVNFRLSSFSDRGVSVHEGEDDAGTAEKA